MSQLVVNEPCCSTTGKPIRTCRCQAHRTNDSGEPHPFFRAPQVTENAQADAEDVAAMTGEYGQTNEPQELLPEIVPDGLVINGEPGDEYMAGTRIDHSAVAANRRTHRSKADQPADQPTANMDDLDTDARDVLDMTMVWK